MTKKQQDASYREARGELIRCRGRRACCVRFLERAIRSLSDAKSRLKDYRRGEWLDWPGSGMVALASDALSIADYPSREDVMAALDEMRLLDRKVHALELECASIEATFDTGAS